MADKRQTVLVIDDTPMNIRVLSELLMDDYEVLFATSGADGLKRALSELPDLILLDIMMPGMDGYEVCQRLKSDPLTADIPVVFVTALSQDADEARGLEYGAIDYIVKPITPAIALARIRNHLKMKRYQDLLTSQALLDGLTGIPNRRRFDTILKQEWQRARRTGSKLSLLMIDIDHFKLYNDHYGHLAGDDCLRAVAKAMSQTMQRGGDTVARYGGEEFACILADTSETGAAAVAGRILKAIVDLQLPHKTSPVAPVLTVSIGGCTAWPEQDNGIGDNGAIQEQLEHLVQCADKNLYRAKQAGRNQVICKQPDDGDICKDQTTKQE